MVDVTRLGIALLESIFGASDAYERAGTIQSFDVCKLPIRGEPHPRDRVVGESDPDDWDRTSDYFELVWWEAYRDHVTGTLYRVRRTSRL